MIPRPLKKFIIELRLATDDSTVQWEEGAGDSFFCNHKQATLHITHDINQETGDASFTFRIVANGKPTIFVVNEDEEEYSTMGDLYSSVMLNAHQLGDVLNTFFDP